MTLLFPSRAHRRPRERVSGHLFAFGADDLSTDLPTGQVLVFARAGAQTVLDAEGRVVTLAHSQVPWSSQYNAAAGLYETGLELSAARTNLCLQSENFGATWAAIGTPVRTAAAKQCGDLVLDLLSDDAGGTLEGYSQVVTFTGNATKMVSMFVAQGTSTSSVVRLRDTTGGANRLLATITWSGSVPSIAMTTGTYVGKVRCYGGVYRLFFLTSSVTAANANQIEVYPATTSGLATANTGTLYVGGVQAENSSGPGGCYIKTTTGTAASVTSEAEAATGFAVQAFTLYCRLAAPYYLTGAVDVGQRVIMSIGDDGGGSNFFRVAYDYSAGWRVTATVADNSATPSARSETAPSGESMTEFAVQLDAPTTAARLRIDTGSGYGAYSSATGAVASLSPGVQLGDRFNVGESLHGILRRLVIAPGAKTLAELRGVSV